MLLLCLLDFPVVRAGNVCCRCAYLLLLQRVAGAGNVSVQSAGLIWQRQRRNLLLARATWCAPTVSGDSMSYLHIKYRNPCRLPAPLLPLTSHKQISLSCGPACAVCMRVCVCAGAAIPHGLVSVAKLIVFTSALHTLRRRRAASTVALSTVIARGRKLAVLPEPATARPPIWQPCCL